MTVAQLVERLAVAQAVGGSSPLGHTSFGLVAKLAIRARLRI